MVRCQSAKAIISLCRLVISLPAPRHRRLLPVICAWTSDACLRPESSASCAQMEELVPMEPPGRKNGKGASAPRSMRVPERGVYAANKSRARHGAPCTRRVSPTGRSCHAPPAAERGVTTFYIFQECYAGVFTRWTLASWQISTSPGCESAWWRWPDLRRSPKEGMQELTRPGINVRISQDI